MTSNHSFALGQRVRVYAQVEKEHFSYQEDLCHLRTSSVLAKPPDMPSRDDRGSWCQNHEYRCILRRPLVNPKDGIIVGYTFRFCGSRWWDGDAGWLSTSGTGVKVWRVATTLRWSEPIDALAEDLELLEEGEDVPGVSQTGPVADTALLSNR